MESVAKGCFVVQGTGRNSNKLRKSLLNPTSYLDLKSQANLDRHLMAENQLSEIKKLIDNVNKNMQSSLLNDLIQFVKNTHNGSSCKQRKEIPSAALIMGVNMPDHMLFIKKITDLIKSEVTPNLALLQARHCSTLKNLMKCVGQQIILNIHEENMHDSENEPNNIEDTTTEKSAAIWKRNTPLTLTILEKWYREQNKSFLSVSPRKKPKLKEHNPIVILFYDTESFKPQVLQDLITMLSSVVPHLPIMFIFSVSTSWAAVVDRQLPHSSIVHLELELFNAISASEQLSMIIEKIVLSYDVPFMLTGKCLQILLDVFLYHDFSTQNFLNNFRYCILEHFYKKRESILCLSHMEDIKKAITKFDDTELAHFRKLSSVENYFSKVTSAISNKMKNDDTIFKTAILDWMYNLHEFHLTFFPCLRCLHVMACNLPRHPLGRQLREIYSACTRSLLVESEDYKEAQLYWKVSSREQLKTNIFSCINALQTFNSDAKRDFPSDYSFVLISTLEETTESLKCAYKNIDNLDDHEKVEDTAADTPEESVGTVKYAYQLKERLKSQAQKKTIAKMTNFEKFRFEFIEVMHNMFQSVLTKIESMPLYEIFYFNSWRSLRNQVVAPPRLSIQKSLSNPYSYLQSECLKLEFPGAIPTHSPDVSIAYKLHSECGRIINLCDWMNAFYTIISSIDIEDLENQQPDIDDVSYARFIRAASELQMLGFIKPTKHKADHVMRLTWSCM